MPNICLFNLADILFVRSPCPHHHHDVHQPHTHHQADHNRVVKEGKEQVGHTNQVYLVGCHKEPTREQAQVIAVAGQDGQ